MKKVISAFLSVMIFNLTIGSQQMVTFAEGDPLAVYRERLVELNETYQTDFEIPNKTAQGGDYSEVIEIYSDMTLEEFDSYISSVVDGSIYDSNHETVQIEESYSDELDLNTSTVVTQRYYYKPNVVSTYLSATSTRKYENGNYKYVSLDKTGYKIYDYPGYVPYSKNYYYTNNNANMNITFYCERYLAAGLIDATLWQIPVTFSASGGPVYSW